MILILAVATLLEPCLADEYVQRNTSSTPGYELFPGISSVPVPISVAPDQGFEGIDGSWNTFSLRVGSTQRNIRVFVSTASQQVWAINPQACISNQTNEVTGVTQVDVLSLECEKSRGFLFNTTESQTWEQKGFYQLWLGRNRDLHGNGLYGFDSVGLGLPGELGPAVQNTTIATLISSSFWLGHFGLHHKSTNFSSHEDAKPSYMNTLFEEKHIPSLSFGYTAGARYYDTTFLGSLTLGGYDASRFIHNNMSFVLAPDNERDLAVGLVGLSVVTTNSTSKIPLLNGGNIYVFIDSTVAELWLPIEVCKAIEDAFGLKYDAATDLYLVDDALHTSLLAQNPSFTFTLGQKFSTWETVNITLPYAAFDLEASPPYRGLQKKTRYFPIRRGNSTQWTLGRTFLQEAYLVVDWERERFSVYANDWTYGKSPDLVPIVSPQYAEQTYTENQKSYLSTGTMIGIAVGSSLVFALAVAAIARYLWQRRHKRKPTEITTKFEADAVTAAALRKQISNSSYERSRPPSLEKQRGNNVLSKPELPGNTTMYYESGPDAKRNDFSLIVEADNTERRIFEMQGDFPETWEADGRQLTEKESMVVREKRYNGTDPSGVSGTSTTTQNTRREVVSISTSDVSMVDTRLRHVSPVTLRTPRDGALLEADDVPSPLSPHRARNPKAGDWFLSSTLPLNRPADQRRFSYES